MDTIIVLKEGSEEPQASPRVCLKGRLINYMKVGQTTQMNWVNEYKEYSVELVIRKLKDPQKES